MRRTGVITTTAALDFEDDASYALDLTVRDGTNTVPLSASFTITNVDEAPTPNPFAALSVLENAQAGAAVGTVTATDPENAPVTYAIATANVPFEINATTGAITATEALDREARASYALTVTATDATGHATSIAAPVTVTDVNEPPVAGAPVNANIAEDVAVGTVVGTASATDPENAAVAYALTTQGVPFAVNAVTGAITTTAALDYEALASYNLAITASDGTNTPVALSASFTVTNVNEAPTAGTPVTANIAENLPSGQTVGTVSATDPEHATLTYALTTQDVPFVVNPATGEIATTGPLDREQRGSYALALTASDGTNTTPLSATVTVTDVDEPPVAGAPAALSVGENLPSGAVVGTISTTDPEGAALTYALTTENVPFVVNPTTGQVTTTAVLDREEIASYSLAFTASDGTTAPVALSATVTVTNVNEVPTAGPPVSASFAENVAVGTVVGTVSATDPEGAPLVYALTTQNVPFAVDPTTGQITTTAAPLDYETATSYALALTASDGTNAAALSASVAVTNVNEAPVASGSTSFTVGENLPSGTVVGTLAAVDPEGSSVGYTLATTGVPFRVNAVTGRITTTAPLDREQLDHYTLTVRATDGTLTTPVSVSIGVNDANEAPVAGAAGPFDIAENLAAGAVVGTVSASDPEGAQLTYTLTTQNVPFAVDAATGRITTTEALDREQLASYNLAIGASDGTNTTQLSAGVNVTNVDEAPVAAPIGPVTLPEDAPSGTTVATLSVADPENTALTFALTTENVPFAVDPATGRVTTTSALNYEETDVYALAITATDATGRSTEINLAVSVADVDEAPVPGQNGPFTVRENLPAGTVVGSVVATNPESPAIGYTLVSADLPFEVNAVTGEITTTESLDREEVASYALEIEATDEADNTTSITVAVNVGNEDEAPAAGLALSATLAETTAVGATVGTVSATDPEGVPLTYALLTQNVPFAVNPTTGAITTTEALDFETIGSYSLDLTAFDGTHTVPLSASFTITDVDEAPAAGPVPSLSVAENESAGAAVGTVSATDPEGEDVTYAITTADAPFAIDPDTGAITTTAPLDRESTASHSLTVTATDTTGHATVIEVEVAVTNVNEPPVAGAPASFTVAENLEAGAVVGRIAATDPEGVAPSYALTTPNVPFTVNAVTGVITTTEALDREQLGSYTLAFTASDGINTTALSASVAVSDVDEAPVAAAVPPTSVVENLPAGTVVRTVSAADPEGTAVTYTLATPEVPFAVNAETGAITTTAALDYETGNSYALVVNATDATGTSAPISVPVTVTNLDEAPLNRTTGTFAAIEGQPAGTAVGTVSATDPDGAAITYAIASGNADGAFAVDGATGVVSTTASFGFSTETSRALGITASDGTQSLDIPITVAIENVPGAPVFTAAAASVPENAAQGTLLGRFSVADAGVNGVSFAGPSGAGYAVATDGTVTLTAALDFEAARSLAVTATAAFTGASPGARSPAGNGAVTVANIYENGASGEAEPPAPVSIQGGTASVRGTSAGFKVVDGNLAYSGENGTTIIPAVERAVFTDGTLSFASDTQEAFLERLYLGLLGREPDGRGIAGHADRLESGATLGQVAQSFAESSEYVGNANGVPTNRAFVESLYVNFLGRPADEEGASAWTNALATGAATRGDIAAGFALSGEAQGKYQAQTSEGVWVADWEDLVLDSLFQAGLGREADPASRAALTDALEAGTLTREALAGAIVNSAEYAARHGSDAAAAVRVIFQDALGRDPEPAALDGFARTYTAQGAAAVLLAVTNSAEFVAIEDPRASGDHLFV
jgi:Cadherin domain/Domain of unknown function (DUF4214)